MARPAKPIDSPEPDSSASETDAAPLKRPSKIAQVLELLRRDEGATLADLVEATGWKPHTTRAALTGLRKTAAPVKRSTSPIPFICCVRRYRGPSFTGIALSGFRNLIRSS